MHSLLVISAAGLASLLAFMVKGRKAGPNAVTYHAKFSGMAVAIAILSTLSWPLMALRGRSTAYVPYNLTPFLGYARHILGMTWQFKQDPEELRKRLAGPSVIVINHQSCLDAFGVVQLWRQVGNLRIVSKKSFQYLGPLGLIGNLADFVFIDRRKGSMAVDQLVAAVLKSKTSDLAPLVVFPEGTRNHDPKTKSLLPFKKGAFIAAVKAKVPVVPVVFQPYTNLDHSERRFDPAVINVSVLEPIHADSYSSDSEESSVVDNIMEKARTRMIQEFQSSH